jgi:hypothetical protein
MYDQPNYMATAVIHDRRHINWRLTGAYAIGALGVGCAIACLLLLLSFKSAYATQMTQMRHVIGQEQAERSNGYNSLNNRFTGMAGIVSAIEAYNMTCSQYLTGPNGGPATFSFPCSDVKPGS